MKILKKLLKILFNMIPSSKIYIFHHVSLNPKIDVSGCKLKTEDFYRFVKKYSKAVSIEEALKGKIFPIGKSVYTFDDGIEDVYEIAYPYLKEKNIPFTVFILTNKIDTPGYITTQQLLKMNEDSLITIGVHGTNHKILPQISKEEQEDEIINGKIILEKLLEKKIDIFAYSHGQYNKKTIEIVKRAGYKYAFSVRELHLNIFSKIFCYEIPRYNVDSMSINNYNIEK